MLADKNIIPPFGVAGGVGGAANRFTVVRDGETIEPSPVPGKVGGFALEAGDVVRIETSGGGGYGDPLARAPDRVRDDVALGYLGLEQAKERYGVVIARRARSIRLRRASNAPDCGRCECRYGNPVERARSRWSAASHPAPGRPSRAGSASRAGHWSRSSPPPAGRRFADGAEVAERTDLALSAEALGALGANAGETVEIRAVHVEPRSAVQAGQETS